MSKKPIVWPTKENCPLRDKHTKHPEGYIEATEWARKKMKTYRQVRCKGCNLFAIWVKKRKFRKHKHNWKPVNLHFNITHGATVHLVCLGCRSWKPLDVVRVSK